jgi:hypothetical protein
MTAGALLADLTARNVTLTLADGKLKCRPRQALTETDLDALRLHKDEVVFLMQADALVADVLRRFDAAGWPADPEARLRLGRRMDAVDYAYLNRDLTALRAAAAMTGSSPVPE